MTKKPGCPVCVARSEDLPDLLRLQIGTGQIFERQIRSRPLERELWRSRFSEGDEQEVVVFGLGKSDASSRAQREGSVRVPAYEDSQGMDAKVAREQHAKCAATGEGTFPFRVVNAPEGEHVIDMDRRSNVLDRRNRKAPEVKRRLRQFGGSERLALALKVLYAFHSPR